VARSKVCDDVMMMMMMVMNQRQRLLDEIKLPCNYKSLAILFIVSQPTHGTQLRLKPAPLPVLSLAEDDLENRPFPLPSSLSILAFLIPPCPPL